MMLYRITAHYRLYWRHPPTSMSDFGRNEFQSSVESPLSNTVASFRKWVIEDLDIKRGSDEYISPRDLERYGIALKFSRQPHQIYDPINFVHNDQREYLSDDEILQYDEDVCIDYVPCFYNSIIFLSTS